MISLQALLVSHGGLFLSEYDKHKITAVLFFFSAQHDSDGFLCWLTAVCDITTWVTAFWITFQFIPGQQLKEGDPGYNSCPGLNDIVHVLVTVIRADLVSLLSKNTMDKLRDVRLAASEMGKTTVRKLCVIHCVDELWHMQIYRQ